MDTELKKEIFYRIAKQFENDLKNGENQRIVFSGKFGTGKTTFLKLFFSAPSSLNVDATDCEVFRISPVNYSISKNEDIIDLIKYDLIIQFLLNPHIEIQTSDIPSYQFISEKDIITIFRALLKIISFKGVDINKILEGLEKLKKDLEEKKLASDEGDLFIKFLDSIESRNGLFERDIITKTIEKVFERISKKGKQTILIVDDLDRVDPEHIFRILNVFSAHFDDEIFQKRGQRNKFGFDKIILVCDYNNIKSLFHSKYGSEADFSGYIDKFYNRGIFNFDIKAEILKYFKELLFKMDEGVVMQYSGSLDYFGGLQEALLERSILSSINFGFLSIRTINKIKGYNIEADYIRLNNLQRRSLRHDEYYTLFLLKLNLFLFQGLDSLLKTFEKLNERNISLDIDEFLAYLFYNIEIRHLRNPKTESELVKFQTPKGLFYFEVDGSTGETNPKKILAMEDGKRSLTNDENLAILTHFINRIKVLS